MKQSFKSKVIFEERNKKFRSTLKNSATGFNYVAPSPFQVDEALKILAGKNKPVEMIDGQQYEVLQPAFSNLTDFAASPGKAAKLTKNSALTGVTEGAYIRLSELELLENEYDNKEYAVKKYNIYRLRDLASQALPQSRVKVCGNYPKKEGKNESFVTVARHKNITGLNFKGLCSCGSHWVCPVCEYKYMSIRKMELQHIIDYNITLEKDIYFLTLTVRHDRSQDLNTQLNTVLGTWNRLNKARKHKELFKSMAYVKTLEIKKSVKHGWHSHLHLLCFMESYQDIAQRFEDFFQDWNKVTGSDIRYSVDFKQANSIGIADYIAKYDIKKEMTYTYKKGAGYEYKDLLMLLNETGEMKYLSWINQYYFITKERHRFTFSKNLKYNAMRDVEVMKYSDLAVEIVANMEFSVYMGVIVKNKLFIQALQVAEHGVLALAEFLQGYTDVPLKVIDITIYQHTDTELQPNKNF